MFLFGLINRLERGGIGILRVDVCIHAIFSKQSRVFNLPFFFLVGISTIATTSACLFTMDYLDNREFMSYIEKPEIGDVYIFEDLEELSEFRYYIWKADQVFQDSIYIIKNIYAYDVIPESMMEDDAFIDIYYAIEKDALNNMYQKGQIMHVRRKYSEYDGFERVIRADLENILPEHF